MTGPRSDFKQMAPRAKGNRLEYNFYFFAIFVMALPFRFVSWLIDVLKLSDHSLADGVFARARRDAANVTPWIFSR